MVIEIIYSISLFNFNFLTKRMSCCTIRLTNSGNGVFVGFQPNKVLALVGSPSNCSTSAGRKYLGSTSTIPFRLQCPLLFRLFLRLPSAIQYLLQQKQAYQNSRTECVFACSNNKIFRFILLQHQPHTLHIVFCISPSTWHPSYQDTVYLAYLVQYELLQS